MEFSEAELQDLAREFDIPLDNLSNMSTQDLISLLTTHVQNIQPEQSSSDFPPKIETLAQKQARYSLYLSTLTDKKVYWVCSICGKRTYGSDTKAWIPITLLHQFPEFLRSSTAPYYAPSGPNTCNNLLIHSSSEIIDDCVLSCKSCSTSLHRNNIPKFAIAYPANWLAPLSTLKIYSNDIIQDLRTNIHSITSSQLPILSMAENDLIARQRLAITVIRLQTIQRQSTAHFGLRGNTLYFPQDPKLLLSKLPPPMSDILKSFIVIVQPHTSNINSRELFAKYRPARVRREVIRLWIEWLIIHNRFYRDCELSEENLSNLPDNGPLPVNIIMQESHQFSFTDFNWAQASEEGGGQHVGPSIISSSDSHLPNSSQSSSILDESNIIHIAASDVAAISLSPIEFSSPQDILQAVDDVFNKNQNYLRVSPGTSLGSLLDATNLLKAFPYLFPHGTGFYIAPEKSLWPTILQHLLQLHDPRFRNDSRFILVAFNALQRMHIALHSRLFIGRNGFRLWKSLFHAGTEINLSDLIELLTLRNTSQGSTQNAINHQIMNDPSIQNYLSLASNISNTAHSVPWSPASKKRRREEIRALMIMYGLPMYFITLAPVDSWNPITEQMLHDDLGPNLPQKISIADFMANPTVCAQGFWEYIALYFEVVLAWKNGKPIKGQKSIFGKVVAYYGTIESQGNGGLHLHLLIWIADIPRPSILLQKVKEDSQYALDFIAYANDVMSVIINDPGTKQQDKVQELCRNIPITSSISDEDFSIFVQRLAKTLNVHLYHNTSCFKYDKKKQICRFFPDGFLKDSPNTGFTDSGTLFLQRQDGYGRTVNAYNPLTHYLFRFNNDIKFIYTGNDVTGLAFYITDYITKRGMPMHEIVTILRSVLLKHSESVNSIQVNDDQASFSSKRLLMSLLVNMTSSQEIAAPMAALFLNGHQDYITSHQFRRVPLYSFYEYINSICPTSLQIIDLKSSSQTNVTDIIIDHNLEDHSSSNEILTSQESMELTPETIQGDFTTLCHDYIYRSTSLEKECLYQYFAKYEKRTLSEKSSKPLLFIHGHPQQQTHGLIHHRASTIKIPVIYPYTLFHNFDHSPASEIYSRYILICFHPWRKLQDLIREYSSWTDAAMNIYATFDTVTRVLIENLHDMAISREAKSRTMKERNSSEMVPLEPFTSIAQTLELSGAFDSFTSEMDQSYNHEDRYNDQDRTAINIGAMYGLFLSSVPTNCHIISTLIHRTQKSIWATYQNEIYARHLGITSMDLSLFQQIDDEPVDLTDQNQNETLKSFPFSHYNAEFTSLTLDELSSSIPQSPSNLTHLEDSPNSAYTTWRLKFSSNIILKQVIIDFTLNPKQASVLHTIYSTLQTNDSRLLLYVGGSGGTGKSRVIHAIQEYFTRHNAQDSLVTMAYTGVAASLIRGATCASMLWGSNRSLDTLSITSMKRQLWQKKRFIIIDEVSMISCQNLATMDLYLRRLCEDIPFGGMHVIFFGDFAQLPPVLTTPLYDRSILNQTINPDDGYIQGSSKAQIIGLGRALWEKVNKVIILTTIQRQNDDRYRLFLERLRWGRCTKDDLTLINSRYIHLQSSLLQDSSEWDNVPLITERKATRDAWNEAKCQSATRYYSIDSIQERTVQCFDPGYANHLIQTTPPRFCKDQDDISGCLSLFIGQRIMIIKNLSVPLGIVNGAVGFIVEIRAKAHPNPKYQFHATEIIVRLLNPPASGTHFQGLENGHVPISAITCRTYVNYHPDFPAALVSRIQIPIIPAYALTDYKSQGSTMEKAIIDLRIPKKKPSIYSTACQHAYVMFSRVKSLDGILLLNKFSLDSIGHLRPDCRSEIKRLVNMDPDLPSEFRAFYLTSSSSDSTSSISQQKRKHHSLTSSSSIHPIPSKLSRIDSYSSISNPIPSSISTVRSSQSTVFSHVSIPFKSPSTPFTIIHPQKRKYTDAFPHAESSSSRSSAPPIHSSQNNISLSQSISSSPSISHIPIHPSPNSQIQAVQLRIPPPSRKKKKSSLSSHISHS